MFNILADASLEWFKSIAGLIGVPGAMLLVFVYALMKGWIKTGREDEEREKARQEQEKARQAYIEELKNGHEADLKHFGDLTAQREVSWIKQEGQWKEAYGRMESEKNEWKDMALGLRATAHEAVNVASKSNSRPDGKGGA